MAFDSKNNNFDAIRLVLSISVFLVHSYELSGCSELKWIMLLLDSDIAVLAFFVVSGFLITMSFHSSRSLSHYIAKRMRRIYPAYFCAVVFMAIVGFFLTSSRLRDYFSLSLVRYLFANLTFLNFLEPSLPGVFVNNAQSFVNGALWTIRFEVIFYMATPMLAFLLRRFRHYFIFGAMYLSAFAGAMLSHAVSPDQQPLLSLLVSYLPAAFACYITGALLYYYHDILVGYAHYLFFISVAGYIAGRIFGIDAVIPIALGIIVVHLAGGIGYMGNVGKYGDFSYGIYIWHFPILQAAVSIGLFKGNPYGAVAISFVVILIFSSVSWHLIEKPFLLRQSHYRIAESLRGAAAKE